MRQTNGIGTAMVRRDRRLDRRYLARGRWRLSLILGRLRCRLGRGTSIRRGHGTLCNVGMKIATNLGSLRGRLLLLGLFLFLLLGFGRCILVPAAVGPGTSTSVGWAAALLITADENRDGLHLLLDIAERRCYGTIPPP